jgi:hypothetical protein
MTVETPAGLVENLGDMNEEPQRGAPDGANRDSRDGLAAVAITLLAAALVIFLLSNIV